MPEKAKRRKNNKNKRKNKNNIRTELNKCSENVNVTVNGDLTSEKNTNSDNSNTAFLPTSNADTANIFPSSSEQIEEVQCPKPNIFVNDSNILSGTQSTNLNNDCKTLESTSHVKPANVLLTTDNPKAKISLNESSSISGEKLKLEENGELLEDSYIVESPESSLHTKPKLNNKIKSKSLDNDDDPKIVELTEDESAQLEDDNTFSIIDSTNIIVSDVESDVEWEKTDDLQETETKSKEFVTGTLSLTTIPLNVAQCELTTSMTPEEERSLRQCLENLCQEASNKNSIEIKAEIQQIINREIKQRLRKKASAEDFFSQRLGPPRILDVIDEEGSGESSVASRRQSYLSDKKSDYEDLEDDVFEDNKKTLCDKYSIKNVANSSNRIVSRLLPQECVLVGARIKEPEITEARGSWSVRTVEKMTGAEVVYLTDSSSSTSSIHDTETGDETDDGVETDVSVRMITPTIEVTDTENLLKNTFFAKNENKNSCNNNIILENSKFESSKEIENNPTNKVCQNDTAENPHEIIILSTDDIKTNLSVKDLNDTQNAQLDQFSNKSDTDIKVTSDITSVDSSQPVTNIEHYDIEMKVLKCELNDAINNLIKEVTTDWEAAHDGAKVNFSRQDSSSSICSSQCTVKYNPTHLSLNDVSNLHDEATDKSKIATETVQVTPGTSHVKDVFKYVSENSSRSNNAADCNQPIALKDLCVQKIAKFPYGEKILEELASVSKRLQNIAIAHSNSKQSHIKNMPFYPLPDVSSIETVTLPSRDKHSEPPPIKPRNSSLKKSHDESHWTGVPTKNEQVYVCLSPSQKMLMEKTNTVLTTEDASELADMHRKYVDLRRYNEYNTQETKNISEDTPVIPFKSQTGSRLLALIRDPTLTSNINSSLNKHNNRFIKQSNTQLKEINDSFSYTKDFSNIFKPIPPPRPKKMSSSFYESDESSEFTDNSLRSMKSDRKFFHYSTGNLSKEIENDISCIQNMHKRFSNIQNQLSSQSSPRRPSLPKDLCDQQMEYIRKKEKEVEAEIRRLEKEKFNSPQKIIPKAPLISEENIYDKSLVKDVHHKKDVSFSAHNFQTEKKGKLNSLFSSSQEEILRDKMYSEYVNQMAERQERKQHKIIKISNSSITSNLKNISKSMSALDILDSKVNNRIEEEFISKARERWNKLGIRDPDTEDERVTGKDVYREPKIIEHKIKVIDGGEEKDVQKLPSHLQEFVRFTAKDKDQGSGSSGESKSGPASPHVVVLCAVIVIVIAVGKYILRLLRYK